MEATKKAVEVMSSSKWILYICNIFHINMYIRYQAKVKRNMSFQIIACTAYIDYACSNTTLRDVTDTFI